jgi:tRNA A37 threonylcarbamoyladenosine dehydratase
LGTISYMPALFGLRIAQEAIRMLLENATNTQPDASSTANE